MYPISTLAVTMALHLLSSAAAASQTPEEAVERAINGQMGRQCKGSQPPPACAGAIALERSPELFVPLLEREVAPNRHLDRRAWRRAQSAMVLLMWHGGELGREAAVRLLLRAQGQADSVWAEIARHTQRMRLNHRRWPRVALEKEQEAMVLLKLEMELYGMFQYASDGRLLGNALGRLETAVYGQTLYANYLVAIGRTSPTIQQELARIRAATANTDTISAIDHALEVSP